MSKWVVNYKDSDIMHYGTKGHSGVYERKKSDKNKIRFSTDKAMTKKAEVAFVRLEADRTDPTNTYNRLSLQNRNKYLKILANAYKALSEPAKREFLKNNNGARKFLTGNVKLKY